MLTKYVIPVGRLAARINHYECRGVTPIIDYAVEHNTTRAMIDEYVRTKSFLVREYPQALHSVKLSSVGMNYDAFDELLKACTRSAATCVIDAENDAVQNTVELFANMGMMNPVHRETDIFKTYQMYRKDSMERLLEDMEMFRITETKHCIKLVRGAYLLRDKRHGVLFDTKEETDQNYDRAARMLLEHARRNEDKVAVMFATHNPKSIDLIQTCSLPNASHAVLMGMDQHLRFTDPSYRINRVVHLPFGPYSRTYPYMFRRLLENNSILDRLLDIPSSLPENPKRLRIALS